MTFILIILILGFVFYYFMQASPASKQEYKENADKTNRNRQKSKTSYGKWVGGGLGWAFGGPLGALIGFALGSMFDGAGTASTTYQRGATQAGDFSVSLLALSAVVMRADGSVKKSELEYVKQFFRQNFSADKTQQMMLILRELLKKDIPLQDVCGQIRQQMAYHDRLQLLHYLFGIAMADGHLHTQEISIIEQIAAYMRISSADLGSIKAMFIKDTGSIYKILEISPNATDEEVKKAYKKMAIKYHPDKVSHLGEEVRQAAEDKFQNLQAAYEEIKKQRGMR